MAGKVTAWVVGVLITALYGYTEVEAVGNLILFPQMSANLGVSVSGVGWVWLLCGIALPPIAYTLALVFGRQRSAGVRLTVLATGVCVLAAVQLEILHLVPQSSFLMLAG